MQVMTMLYSVLLMPIQLVFELVFSAAYELSVERAGVAIIALSLAINLLVLPLYRRADAMQEEERLTEQKLRDGVQHIKKTFRGNERTMMLQTYYRQNHYSPLYVLRGAVSLLLEIPFFIAAYNYLSGLSQLQGVKFGPIADLGQPDAMLSFGSFSVNILPILMTAINVVSTVIFTKGHPLKAKIQLYGMAAIFLVLLYDSPAGLVFYWTLNNLFSLVKTIFYKLKNPKKVLRIMLFCIGVLTLGFGVYDHLKNAFFYRTIFLAVIGVGLCVPFLLALLRRRFPRRERAFTAQPNRKLFLLGALLLTVLNGLLIPSAVISASPQEFVIVGNFVHPVWYIVSATLIAVGFFILWLGIFYWLFSPKAKVIFERVMVIAGVAGIVNYLFFSNHLGILSADLIYDNEIYYSALTTLLNIAVIIAIAVLTVYAAKKFIKVTCWVLSVATMTLGAMSVINTAGIIKSIDEVDVSVTDSEQKRPQLTLSKDGRNVVVIMLDRAMGEYVPYIMQEHPELAKQFEGFTFYSNTISFGGHTNFGVPALFGGYEYTPVEMNRRDDESLADKHNEALKVMPAIFDGAGYQVTVCDAPYAGYKEIPDLSIYDDYPDIKTYITQGVMSSGEVNDRIINSRMRNFFCHSIVKTVPVFLQAALYYSGSYHASDATYTSFSKSYDVLKQLSDITTVTNDANGCFLMLENDATHNSVLFEDERYLNPTADYYNSQKVSSMTIDGVTLTLDTRNQISTYQTNVAALMRLGDWFDTLREQGVYDNTRFIIASDHGFSLQQIDELLIDDTAYADGVNQRYGDAEFYYPLLLVKDFDSSEPFTTSDTFMTLADVPTIATQGVIENPVNPFTDKPIENSEKTAHEQYVIASDEISISKNNGNTFLPARWYSVSDSIWDRENWKLVTNKGVLP